MPLKTQQSELEIEQVSKSYLAGLCRQIRTEEDLTQREMAALLNVSNSTYQSWEDARHEPHGSALVKLLLLRAKRRNVNVFALLPFPKEN